jgi:hypothetical protein
LKHDLDQDQSLLMLAVGESKGFAKLSAEAHLLACKKCQSRINALQAVSFGIAKTLACDRPRAIAPFNLGSIKMKFTAYVAGLVVLTSAAIGGVVIHKISISHPAGQNLHCLPGIASDQCR